LLVLIASFSQALPVTTILFLGLFPRTDDFVYDSKGVEIPGDQRMGQRDGRPDHTLTEHFLFTVVSTEDLSRFPSQLPFTC
jgi:hypothetical protein